MNKNKFLTGFLIIFISAFLQLNGQTGIIEGSVSDKASSELLIGTTIMIEGTTTGTTSDVKGGFVLKNIKPGVYNLKVSYVSYNTSIIEKVKVEEGKTTIVKAEMESAMQALADVNVTAVRRTNTEISMITDIKSSSFVSTGISGQQISKSLDKDASEVVKRVPGITIMENRFLVVRGLSQRYNNVWLNNAATPSSEADVKAFSFDIIPSAMIENIMIFKSPAAELPADFSGGFVKITTKNMPDKNSAFISYGTGFSEGSTFNTFYTGVSVKTDWLGFDNGSRSLPADMPLHLNEYESATNPSIRERITTLGRELNNSWEASQATAIPDQKLMVGVNRRKEFGNISLGNTTALNYSFSNSSDEIFHNDYSIYDFTGDKPSYLNQFIDEQYSRSARISLLNNTSVLLGKSTKLELRNLVNQSGTFRYSLRNGREWYNDGRYIRSEEQRYVSRLVYSGQLAGEHTFKGESTKLDWVLGYAYSNKKEPDTRRFRYIRDQVDTSRYMLLFADQADLSSQSRMWIDLVEHTTSGSVNFTRKLIINSFMPEIKTGLYYEQKQRSFNARNFGYAKGSSASVFGQTTLAVSGIFNDANLNLTDGIKLMEVTSLSDSYTASNLQMAGYLTAKIPAGPKVNIYAGMRIERNRQTLSSFKQGSTIRVEVDRDTINLFPSANITYNISDKSLIRTAYGMSVNRPEFREIAPFYYVDFEMNAGIYGAPQIRQAYIHSFDLRYELYPKSGEIFNIGAFYKKFINPIEQVILGNSPTQYSFENVKSAYTAGLEAEMRKSLGFIRGMDGFTMVVNSSVISSRVQFEQSALARNRPLEGQSPFIVNAGLFYQTKNNDLMVSLLYNVIGKRIVAVGRPSPNMWEDIPDIYEMPRNVLDLTFSKIIGKKIEIKGGIKDILNEKVKYVQTIDALVDMDIYSNGATTGMKQFDRQQFTKSWYPGRYFSLGVTIKL
ncbi:MAG: carboxypeptidase-like regulatory domain-containing protein [Bacteroidia bacterium]|nr:carboxypeptidase-like regulatory domain-containing protein [Bacteroidia bacterium]